MNQLSRKHKFPPLRLISIEAEGFSYLPRQEILIHPGITIANGENGSGKTTFLNMFRVLFGATKFDNGHTLKTFFEREHVDFIYILGRYDNTIHPDFQKRPFQNIGKFKDDVTVVCRLTNDNQIKREYIIFDGIFDLDKHLGLNLHWLEVGKYLDQMELVGMSKTLAHVFSFHQGNTESILNFNEEELADYLLKICGEQERIEKFAEIQIHLEKLYQQYQEIGKQKQQEELIIQHVKQKIDRIKQIKINEQQLEEYLFKQPLAKAKNTKDAQQIKELEMKKLKDKESQYSVNITQTNAELLQTNNEIKKSESLLTDLEGQVSETHIQINDLIGKKTKLEATVLEMDTFVNKYKSIEPLSIEKLNRELNETTNLYKKQITAGQTLENSQKEITANIKHIQKTNSSMYPSIVSKMIDKLKEHKLNHLILAEQIEITDNNWRQAIEALLGNERFTITVDQHSIVETMKIAQEIGYPYWISPFKPTALSFTNKSILTKIEVLDDRITGYLERFKNFMMAENIESAWNWVQQGYSALLHSPTPYQVVSRGGRSIQPKGIYCGRQSYLLQLKQLQVELKDISQNLVSERKIEEQLALRIEGKKQAITDQEMRILLPNKESELSKANHELKSIKNNIFELQNKLEKIQSEKGTVLEQYRDNFRRHGELNEKLKNFSEKQKKNLQTISIISTAIENLESEFNMIVSKFSKNQMQKLNDTSFLGSLETEDHYNAQIMSLQNAIKQLRNTGEPILPSEENMVALEEKYNMHLRLLQNHLSEIGDTEAKLEQLKKKHDEAKEEYFDMIEEVFRKVKRSLEELAAEGNINATLKLMNVGNEKWKIDYKIGFHGKEPESYRTKTAFSGGQKVIISLLLTLAAVKADGMLNFMILDEPFAHLDQERTELVSHFLKDTGAQYIIAMPYSENLKLLFPFANMSLNFKPKQENQAMAPPITYGVINDEFIKQHTQFKASS
ncbi:hypothetical protein [Robertmurraya andreesenii]|uniref:Chromosome segregation ATPase n=1 Tax=Anoxybacillus andreesenii TaxID=1325932 RepID=A0ABT9V8X6_9BACL|nr:hypothetical protein [Robertmurraya andreesenii]MDQ0157394.1 chromosome segregation ATPase [Robertmurraya andreesenii]